LQEIQVSLSDLRRKLGELINRVAYGGERVVLLSRGRPKAVLIGLTDLQKLQALGDDGRERRMAALEGARALRRRIGARAGGELPDSAQELNDLREERDEELHRLR